MNESTNLIIQYGVVVLALLGVVVWIARKLWLLRKKGPVKSCCGCSMADSCCRQSAKDIRKKEVKPQKECCCNSNLKSNEDN